MYSYGPPTHGRAKAGRPARTYIQQLCEDTGCCPEDLPRAMNDREEWRERVRGICATSATWWWWWWWTFLQTANNPKAEIDYIFMNKKWINSALNNDAYSSFEGMSSDHRIVTAKIRLSRQKNLTQTIKTANYDWSLLNNSDKYTITLRNKFDAPHWINLKHSRWRIWEIRQCSHRSYSRMHIN